MNVTPLIDVLLVLIIIFMVVIPHHSRGEQADIPQPSPIADVSNPENDIVVQLLNAGEGERPRIKINQSDVSWDELSARIKAVLLLRAQRIAFLKGDPEVEFAYVA